jgi:hypothetical protein
MPSEQACPDSYTCKSGAELERVKNSSFERARVWPPGGEIHQEQPCFVNTDARASASGEKYGDLAGMGRCALACASNASDAIVWLRDVKRGKAEPSDGGKLERHVVQGHRTLLHLLSA